MPQFDITQGLTRAGQGGADAARGADLTMTTPARPAGFVSDWIVPVMQSLTTGALVAGLVIFLMGELTPAWEVNRFKVWAGLALAISCGVWVVLLKDTRDLLRQIESLTGLDINRDGQIGDERIVIVNAGPDKPTAQQKENARQSQFARFVRGLEAKGTDLRSWEKEIPREQYQEYRDALIRLRWAAWRSVKDDGTPNERQGWELTKPAGEILERISSG